MIGDHYRARAQKAIDEWDGVDTADLLKAICHNTAENFHEVVVRAVGIPSEVLSDAMRILGEGRVVVERYRTSTPICCICGNPIIGKVRYRTDSVLTPCHKGCVESD